VTTGEDGNRAGCPTIRKERRRILRLTTRLRGDEEGESALSKRGYRGKEKGRTLNGAVRNVAPRRITLRVATWALQGRVSLDSASKRREAVSRLPKAFGYGEHGDGFHALRRGYSGGGNGKRAGRPFYVPSGGGSISFLSESGGGAEVVERACIRDGDEDDAG
jgi:hypothetical protein